MVLHVNQDILGAVQKGECSELNDTNPYEAEDIKRFEGWKQGHKRVVAEQEQIQKWNATSFFRKILCKIGIHKDKLSKIPGRPHIKDGKIVSRDSIIKKFTCIHCDNVHFIGRFRCRLMRR